MINISSQTLAKNINNNSIVTNLTTVLSDLTTVVQDDDIVLCVGAGSIGTLATEIVNA